MLLLNTTTYALERVARPDKYAILSHTWEADEVTFDDMKSLDEAKRKGGWSKVQQACRVAAEISRCKYIWIDSCCIDKSSSAELSEAINSMFSYYQDAEVCYVYLSDLLDSSGSGIRLNLSRCRWFTRGWTLQELVAPRMIIFYNHRWDFIGSKQSLMDQLVNITNIDRSVLVDASVLSTVPVGRRMGWAAKRQTTRVEDAAYCLLGIFDVNMPMIYGEGGKAFIRLQEAIALTTNDLSLFAWSDESPNPWHQSYQGIFARSPVQFSDCHLLENVHDPLEYNTRSLAITNRGVEFQTSLQSDRENGDYLMFLHCRQGTAGYGPSGEVETIAIRLLKTPNGFIRHRSDVVFHDLTIVRIFLQWHRLRHVPGPFLNSLTSLVQVKKVYEGGYHLYLDGLAKKYGPLVRIGPNEVMFSDPETLQRLSAIRSPFTKGPWYEGARAVPGHDHVFSLVDEQKHKERKAKMGPGYAGMENGGFEISVDKIIGVFIDLLERKYISTATESRLIEFSTRVGFLPLDVISEVAFGEPFGFLKNDKDMFDYLHQMDQALPFIVLFTTIPGLYKWKDRWPLKKFMPNEKDEFGMGRMQGFATEFVDKRLAPDAKPGRDIVQSFINRGMKRDELISDILLQILAGSETTSTVIRMTLLHLINTPSALRRLTREIDQGIASGKISAPVTNAQCRAMPYLQAVIREGLRIWPPSTALHDKQVPEGGDRIHGFWLPGGTQVGQNMWGICRSREMFGEDADVFRPERWLLEKGERLKGMVGAVDMNFGYGKYQCLGKNLAWMEVNKVLVEMLRRYDFAIVNPVKPMEISNAAVWVTNDFWLRITRREEDDR
ncbi:cytochrome P450 [Bombardia bombarda]|uniref:Cytochrome P450 n=1 Tax=Bombardia bombarda TaxID=252184 RepID=A0AA39WUY7_9PEZI|nr:cytochrome P450 [Bombardia bombarda]